MFLASFNVNSIPSPCFKALSPPLDYSNSLPPGLLASNVTPITSDLLNLLSLYCSQRNPRKTQMIKPFPSLKLFLKNQLEMDLRLKWKA